MGDGHLKVLLIPTILFLLVAVICILIAIKWTERGTRAHKALILTSFSSLLVLVAWVVGYFKFAIARPSPVKEVSQAVDFGSADNNQFMNATIPAADQYALGASLGSP
jgi:hypothetical protein